MQFIHVHNHSDYSLLKATSTPGGLASAAREMNMPAIALTDDANLFGACAFYRECRKAGVKPIIGCDFFLAPHSRHQKSTIEDGRQYQRMVLLAKNREGYRNLVMLSSLAYTEGFYYKPRIDQELLQKYHAGLIALSGGFGGEIPQLINRNRVQEAREKADFYTQTFGRDNFYLELTDHGIAGQQQINHSLITISRDMNIPLVAANDTYYLRKDDADAHDVLLCIGNKRKKNEPGRFRFSSDQFYLKSPEEMWKLFGDYPDALENTLKIYEQCNLEMEFSDPLFPHYEIPNGFDNPDAYLRHISHEGFLRRYENPDQNLRNRLNYELETIIKMGFSNYLLIVWDFICYARDAGIPVGPGRGSGAGSMVAYSLGITDIDPMEYGLLFERFLNPERVSMPDLDIDFCFARRQELIDYVTRKYGSDRVGQIITFGTLKPRAVIRDVARVLDISYDEADHAAKLIPEGLKTTIDSALADEPQLKKLYTADTRYRELIDVSRKLQNLHRHASTHAAGIVIGKEALTRYVPLFRDSRTGAISTQFTMEELEDNGLVKMDILGLKTLTLIQNTLNHISLTDTEFDINAIPGDDPKTFEMLGEGKSLAVFQFESGGMQKILIRAQPTCIEDLIALNSLFRPGPMENIGQFIDAKQGRVKITYPHPDLEPILKETYGVIVYQEQVMETVRIIAGFSLGKADILRRAMGKKKEKDMAKMRVEYMDGAAKRGIDKKTAADIFDLLKPFAGYGFNKSHAAAYSVLAYKTAYLKAHYPAQFMAANLTNESDNNDTFALYLNEIKKMDMDIRPPDINESDKYFTVSLPNTPAQQNTAQQNTARNGAAPPPSGQKGAQQNEQKERQRIIFGLMGIKGVGSSAVDEILSTRDRPYTSLEDFFERIDLRLVNRRTLEILAQCGSFNSICPSRKAVLDNLDSFINTAHSRKSGKMFGQTALFEPEEEYPAIQLRTHEDYSLPECLKWEKELVGCYFSGHPLDNYRKEWASGTNLNLAKITPSKAGEIFRIVALVSRYREMSTKKGGIMAAGLLEDFQGTIEFVMFPDIFAKYAHLLQPDIVLSFTAECDIRDNRKQLIIQTAQNLEQIRQSDNGEIHFRLREIPEDNNVLIHLRQLIHTHPGNCPVIIHINVGSHERILRGSATLRGSISLINELENHACVEEVWQEYMSKRI